MSTSADPAVAEAIRKAQARLQERLAAQAGGEPSLETADADADADAGADKKPRARGKRGSGTSRADEGKKKETSASGLASRLAGTRLCAMHLAGACRRKNCMFAHSVAELRPAPDLRKTRICPALRKGKCTAGKECNFAHSKAELRPAPESGAGEKRGSLNAWAGDFVPGAEWWWPGQAWAWGGEQQWWGNGSEGSDGRTGDPVSPPTKAGDAAAMPPGLDLDARPRFDSSASTVACELDIGSSGAELSAVARKTLTLKVEFRPRGSLALPPAARQAEAEDAPPGLLGAEAGGRPRARTADSEEDWRRRAPDEKPAPTAEWRARRAPPGLARA